MIALVTRRNQRRDGTIQTPDILVRESAPGGLAARQSDGDVAHRGIGLGSVPVALTRLHVSDVTHLDLKSLGFCGDPPAARSDDQDLIAIVDVPARVAPLA